MTLIRKENTLNIHLHHSHMHPHQTAMDLGNTQKAMASDCTTPKTTLNMEGNTTNNNNNQDFWSDSLQTSLSTVPHAIFSTSSVHVPFPVPCIGSVPVPMQLATQFYIAATCSREACEHFHIFFLFIFSSQIHFSFPSILFVSQICFIHLSKHIYQISPLISFL